MIYHVIILMGFNYLKFNELVSVLYPLSIFHPYSSLRQQNFQYKSISNPIFAN